MQDGITPPPPLPPPRPPETGVRKFLLTITLGPITVLMGFLGIVALSLGDLAAAAVLFLMCALPAVSLWSLYHPEAKFVQWWNGHLRQGPIRQRQRVERALSGEGRWQQRARAFQERWDPPPEASQPSPPPVQGSAARRWSSRDDAILEAAKLASALKKGWHPPPIPTSVILEPGESLYYQAPFRLLDDYSEPETPNYVGSSAPFFHFFWQVFLLWDRREAKRHGWQVAAGTMHLTNRRFLLETDKRWICYHFSSIRRIGVQADGILLSTTDKPHLKLLLAFPEWTHVLFRYLALEERSSVRLDPDFLARARAAGREVPEWLD